MEEFILTGINLSIVNSVTSHSHRNVILIHTQKCIQGRSHSVVNSVISHSFRVTLKNTVEKFTKQKETGSCSLKIDFQQRMIYCDYKSKL